MLEYIMPSIKHRSISTEDDLRVKMARIQLQKFEEQKREKKNKDKTEIAKLVNAFLKQLGITIDEKFALKRLSKDNISINLKYPQNSRYNENSWNITRIDNEYSVSCSVDAPNTFGMIVTHQFFLTYQKENEKFIITSMDCDGKYLIKSTEITQKLTVKDKKAVEELNKALGL